MKKLEKVLKRTRNGLIGLGLSGALMFGAVGCETMNSADWLALGFGSVARDKDKTEEQREAAAYLEDIAEEQARRKHERDIAEKSRDETKQEVNVYVGEEEKEKENVYVERKKEPEQSRYFFACNYFKDFDGNGAGNYPEEYVGIKNKFRDNEKIILVSHDEKSKKGQLWKMEIYNPSGEIIHKLELTVPYNGIVMKTGENFDMTNWLIQNGGYGSYKTVWYLNNKYNGSSEFEIVPSGE